jgi:hypothetical protein
MFNQVNAQTNVNTSLFTVTPASIGSQRTQAMSSSAYKYGQVPNVVAQRSSLVMSAANNDKASAPNKFV